MTARAAIGVDVGGTKIAAGIVDMAIGAVLARRRQPTEAVRGGQAVLDDVIAIARELKREAEQLGVKPCGIGVGLPELVGVGGEVLSSASFDWTNLGAARVLSERTGLAATLEADVRAAARAEAQLGAGRGLDPVLYVTIGTGISACLAIGGEPFRGARGLTGTFASSPAAIPREDGRLVAGLPLEAFAAGPAIAARYSASRGDGPFAAPEVVERAAAGDPLAVDVVRSAGEAIGAAVAQLVNMLDPAIVVSGGGMGLVKGLFRESLDTALRRHVWSDIHRDVPLVSAALGADAGVVGAALAAICV